MSLESSALWSLDATPSPKLREVLQKIQAVLVDAGLGGACLVVDQQACAYVFQLLPAWTAVYRESPTDTLETSLQVRTSDKATAMQEGEHLFSAWKNFGFRTMAAGEHLLACLASDKLDIIDDEP